MPRRAGDESSSIHPRSSSAGDDPGNALVSTARTAASSVRFISSAKKRRWPGSSKRRRRSTRARRWARVSNAGRNTAATGRCRSTTRSTSVNNVAPASMRENQWRRSTIDVHTSARPASSAAASKASSGATSWSVVSPASWRSRPSSRWKGSHANPGGAYSNCVPTSSSTVRTTTVSVGRSRWNNEWMNESPAAIVRTSPARRSSASRRSSWPTRSRRVAMVSHRNPYSQWTLDPSRTRNAPENACWWIDVVPSSQYRAETWKSRPRYSVSCGCPNFADACGTRRSSPSVPLNTDTALRPAGTSTSASARVATSGNRASVRPAAVHA